MPGFTGCPFTLGVASGAAVAADPAGRNTGVVTAETFTIDAGRPGANGL